MKWIGVEPVVVLFTLAYTIQQCVQSDFIFMRECEKHHSKEVSIVPEGKMGHFCQIVILGTFKGLFREPPYTM